MKWVPAVLLLALALAATACDDSPSSPSPNTRFTLRLTSSAYSSAPAVLVTFSRVRAVRSSGGSEDVSLPNGASTFTCDLRRLQSSDGEIAAGALATGDYSEVRLMIQSVTLYLDNPSDAACAANLRAPGGRSASVSGPRAR